ncbi:MAG: alpha-galactosidase, partial [Spirochaetia bacterium]|nr:alpha-galactosidase [Spirochaetia bacterium]
RLRWKHNVDENPETPAMQTLDMPMGMMMKRGAFHSEGLLALEEIQAGPPGAFVLATAGPGNQFVRFRVILHPRTGRLKELAVIWDFNGMLFSEHGRMNLTPVMRLTGQGDVTPLIDQCVVKSGKEFGRAGKRVSVAGWCSWYHYYTKISDPILRENLRLIKQNKLDVDVFQIDDGYQRTVGDWLQTNDKFPEGMKPLAQAVRREGLEPGIWIAPFLARPDANLVKEHPEMILRDASGEPVHGIYNPLWGGETWTLDVTHPKFEKWLVHVIDTVVNDWGYTYLKLDFLYAAVYRGLHHDPRTTGMTRLRDTLALIRKTAGKNAFLLACGCPFYAAAGIVDANRISCDVNHVWDGHWMQRLLRDRNYPVLRSALINAVTRSFFHRRFWINDPDCLMVRRRQTKLTSEQVTLMASVMALSGGMILVSDDLSILEPDRFDIVRKSIALNRQCAAHTPVPIGLMESEFPVGLYNPAGFVGIWNPTSEPDRLRITLPEDVDMGKLKRARDLWTGGGIPWTVGERDVQISLGPFESFVACL